MEKNPGNQVLTNIFLLKDFLDDAANNKSKVYANGIIALVQNNYSIIQPQKIIKFAHHLKFQNIYYLVGKQTIKNY
jgi:hypothetical protein